MEGCLYCYSNIICATCSNGYFLNSTTLCQACSTGCALCTSLTNCQACLSGFYRFSDQLCYSTCPPRYYGDDESHSCKLCSYDCYTCNPNGTCLTCNPTIDYRILDSGSNRCVAMKGYFDNLTTIARKCLS